MYVIKVLFPALSIKHYSQSASHPENDFNIMLQTDCANNGSFVSVRFVMIFLLNKPLFLRVANWLLVSHQFLVNAWAAHEKLMQYLYLLPVPLWLTVSSMGHFCNKDIFFKIQKKVFYAMDAKGLSINNSQSEWGTYPLSSWFCAAHKVTKAWRNYLP